jgi:hypothetical protein
VKVGERRFNPAPGWPQVPAAWKPPAGWSPPAEWGEAPPGWQVWITDEVTTALPLEDAVVSAAAAPPVRPETHSWLTPAPKVESFSQRLERVEAENADLREYVQRPGQIVDGVIQLDDQKVLQEVGIYRYHHPLENAAAYLPRLRDVETRSAALVREDRAIEKSNMFTFDNSLAKGRKMSGDLAKLMLRAYNAESENSIRTLKVGNVLTAKRRLESSREAIARLGAMMQMHISDEYHALRLEEIELTADWLMMKQEEKETEREERSRLREERRVEKELADERALLDKERAHLTQTVEALRLAGTTNPDLEQRLAEIEQAIVDNDFKAANIRAGYVYVISNRGAFGEGVVKIGLTRRLEPRDRVHELGGASVPFRFDVHTIYFSEDAVTLENELHRHFAQRAVNQANSRKEFFFATPAEVRDVLASKVGNLLEFAEGAEATEYNQSVGRWPKAPDGRLAISAGARVG